MNFRAIVIFWLAIAQGAFAGVYQLSFRRVAPASNRPNCQLFVEATADELSHQSDVEIIDAACQEDNFTLRGLDAVITYRALARLSVTSTHIVSVYSTAFYLSSTECSKQLPLQRDLFVRNTGLKPLSASCVLDVGMTPTWSTRVDGLGETKMKPDVVGLSLWGTLIDESAVLASFRTALQYYDLTLFEAGISPSGMDKKLVLRLYASDLYRLEDYQDMQYENIAGCSTAASKVGSFLKDTEKPVVVFCERTSTGGAKLHVTTPVQLIKPAYQFKAVALITPYASLSVCEKAAGEVALGSTDTFGAACAGRSGSFHIHVFSRS